MSQNAASNYLATNSRRQMEGIIRMGYAQVGYRQGIKFQNISQDNYNKDNPFIYQNQIEISVEVGEESVLYLYTEQGEALDTVTVINLNTGEKEIFKLPEWGWMNGISELGTWEDVSLKI